MKFFSRTSIYLLLSLLIFTSGCVKYYQIPEISERQVTVNGLLIAGEKPIVTVKESYLPSDTVIFDLDNSSEANLITNALVVLSTEEGKQYTLRFVDSIYYQGVGLKGYTTDSLIPREGNTYYLKVYVPGYDTLYSFTKVPYSPRVDTFFIRSSDTVEFSSDLSVDIVIQDSCVTPEYYFVTGYGSFYTEDPNCIIFPASQSILLPDRNFNCTKYTFSLTVDMHTPELRFYKANIDLGVYIETLYQQVSQRRFSDFPNPFQEPVVVYSNIQNGTGIFAALSRPFVITINTKKNEKADHNYN